MHGIDANTHNTFFGITNGIKVNNIAENLCVNAASGLLSRREIVDAICRPRLTRRNEDNKDDKKSEEKLTKPSGRKREEVIREVKVR